VSQPGEAPEPPLGDRSAPPPDRSDEWTGWKPVIVIVGVLGALPVLVLAVAYLAHIV
jgi:hypothetical protein